ncbi:MAG: phosphonoacetaldehyde reductase [Desulfovibrio sp.]|jgi:alcohol dehydrogenase class IV|nr:phosphonoacetaldehyde reductase [Desulfovibrio sp.]
MAVSFGGFCPVELYFLDLNGMYDILNEYPEGSTGILVADKTLLELIRQAEMPEKLAKRYDLIWVDHVTPNPTQMNILDSLKKIGSKEPTWMVAVGGGSAIDQAKGISASYDLFKGKVPSLEDITAMIKQKTYLKNLRPIPICAIPTTAGTGSEVTKWATIWDVYKTAKFSIDDEKYYPKTALIVPQLTYGAPKKLILSTGLDAMSHSMEAFWAKPSNPIVKDVATIAIKRIYENLPLALKNPLDEKARAALSTAAALSGVAFSNTRTTACHSISYPMTMQFGVDHGFACAVTLVEVAKINRSTVPAVDALIDEVFGGYGQFQKWMDEVSHDIQPLKLSAFGIDESGIKSLTKAAFTAGRMDNNPVDITPEQVAGILERCL